MPLCCRETVFLSQIGTFLPLLVNQPKTFTAVSLSTSSSPSLPCVRPPCEVGRKGWTRSEASWIGLVPSRSSAGWSRRRSLFIPDVVGHCFIACRGYTHPTWILRRDPPSGISSGDVLENERQDTSVTPTTTTKGKEEAVTESADPRATVMKHVKGEEEGSHLHMGTSSSFHSLPPSTGAVAVSRDGGIEGTGGVNCSSRDTSTPLHGTDITMNAEGPPPSPPQQEEEPQKKRLNEKRQKGPFFFFSLPHALSKGSGREPLVPRLFVVWQQGVVLSIGVIMGVAMVAYFFSTPMKEDTVHHTAVMASEALQNTNLQKRAIELSKLVVRDVLNDPNSLNLTVKLVTELLGREEVKIAISSLLLALFEDRYTQEITKKFILQILRDHWVTEQLDDLTKKQIYRLLANQELKNALSVYLTEAASNALQKEELHDLSASAIRCTFINLINPFKLLSRQVASDAVDPKVAV